MHYEKLIKLQNYRKENRRSRGEYLHKITFYWVLMLMALKQHVSLAFSIVFVAIGIV